MQDRVRYGSSPPASLDDAITEIREPFEGTRLLVFDWEPPPRTGYRVLGYQFDELVLEMMVPAEQIARAKALARIPETDPDLHGSYPLSREEVQEIVGLSGVFGGFSYFLEADAEAAT